MSSDVERSGVYARQALYETLVEHVGQNSVPSHLLARVALLVGGGDIRFITATATTADWWTVIAFTDSTVVRAEGSAGGEDERDATTVARPRSGLRSIALDGLSDEDWGQYWTPAWPTLGRLVLDYGEELGIVRLPAHHLRQTQAQREMILGFLPSLMADLQP
jgi:hypothetical protein